MHTTALYITVILSLSQYKAIFQCIIIVAKSTIARKRHMQIYMHACTSAICNEHDCAYHSCSMRSPPAPASDECSASRTESTTVQRAALAIIPVYVLELRILKGFSCVVLLI